MHWIYFALYFIAETARCSPSYRSVAYFVNWSLNANFTPQDLPVSSLTHVLYAFADVRETGEVFLTDALIDTGNVLADTWNNTGTNLYGFLEQFYRLKKNNRQLKVLLSVGGWAHSTHFALPASSPEGRSMFAASAISLVQNLGLDGIDIDWEYPINTAEGQDLVSLLKAVREELDAHGDTQNPFTLTVAGPAPFGYKFLQLANMDYYVDFWNLMAYDYVGAWSASTGDQANIEASIDNPASTPFNTQDLVGYYKSQNISVSKLVLGMPLYGRYFNKTSGLGQAFNGSGTYDVRVLPLGGAQVFYNSPTGSSYSYDPSNQQLVSYDNAAVAAGKANWVLEHGLGGVMFWESSQDSLEDKTIQSTAAILSRNGSLESSFNHLSYPNSTYGNIAGGLSQLSSSSTPSAVVPTSTASSPASSSPSPVCGVDTCKTYTARDCSGQACSCALTAENSAACVIHRQCVADYCSKSSECSGDAVCIVDNCCPDGKGRCLYTASIAECLSGPLCKRYDGGAMPDAGGGTGLGLIC